MTLSQNTKNIIKALIALLLLCILCIIVIILFKVQKSSIKSNIRYIRIKHSSPETLYTNIIGDQVDDSVKHVVKTLTKKKNRTIKENMILGDIWYRVLHDYDQANTYYNNSVTRLREANQINVAELEEIGNREYGHLYDFYAENNLNVALANDFEINSRLTLNNFVTHSNDNVGKLEMSDIVFKNLAKVSSDAQNVHD